jgi:molybdopterin-guanine dinucleotide biosynthesis protein A
MADVTPIIVAGGLGTRLGGVKKATLEVGGRPVIERVLDAVRPIAERNEIIVVDNDDSLSHLAGVRIVPDAETRAGVLMALHSGLTAAESELCVVVACDMPFLNTYLLRWLIELAGDFDIVMPVTDGRMDPMHAVYRRVTCLETIGNALARGDKRMISYLGDVRVREVMADRLRLHDPNLYSFFNINTVEDLAQARHLASL